MIVKISFTILWIITVLKPASGQVNTYTEKLENDLFHSQSKIHLKEWFYPQNISNFAKLMVCVDVWQKIKNKRVVGGKYKPLTSDQRIPNLEVHTMDIKIAIFEEQKMIQRDRILHCALNTIQFEKNSFQPGPEFYVTYSAHEYCLYLLLPEYDSTGESILRIKAEVCGILVDIKYNTIELENEYMNAINDPAEGLNQIIWDEIIRMNNESRSLLCLEVYEKITRNFFFTGIAKNELPVCKSISANLILESSKQNGTAQYVMALHCPLDEIEVLNNRIPRMWTHIPPIYLAKSIRSGCVYVLGETKPIDSNREEDEPELSVFIKAEICGVLGSVRDDVYQLETEFSTKEQYLKETYNSNNRLTYSYFDRFQLCIMIYRKLYQELLERCKFYYRNLEYEGTVLFRTIKSQNKYVNSLYCPIKVICLDAKVNKFYAIDSINLGCLYVIRSTIDGQRIPDFNIFYEICGIYSFQHLLKIKHSKINQPILNLVDNMLPS